MNASSTLTIDFAPLLPVPILLALGTIIFVLFCLATARNMQGVLWRTVCAAAFLLILANPSLLEEERKPIQDVAALIVDRSPSQNNGERTRRTDETLAALRTQLENRDDIDLRIVEAPQSDAGLAGETELFSALSQAFSDVPQSRRAGAILLTDGQVHDLPDDEERFDDFGPVHGLLTGERNERDRHLKLLQAPAYGIVGQSVTITFRVEDHGIKRTGGYANLTIRENAGEEEILSVPVNQDYSFEITVDHAGQNIVELEVAELTGEISAINNKAAILVNGVRDRLKVLLVSGKPHAGGRTWRDLLTADPGIDLVHFTILREPEKLDATPSNELSLIAFPFRELFEIKLYDFDLIIFDRYQLNRIMPNYYFANIARYVREGGALLEASGPSFANELSVYNTSLNTILPARPAGRVAEQGFVPALTDTGRRHPVTMDLTADEKNWGPWLRQVIVQPKDGDVVMSGADSSPLLILNRVGKGRVAQMASDEIWLWSRGYQGGGPHIELLRRLAHWLMKEPELDEDGLDIRADASSILIRRRSLHSDEHSVQLKFPDGTDESITLQRPDDSTGWMQARIDVNQQGVYTVEDGDRRRFAVIGDLNAPEFSGLRTTAEALSPITEASNGGIHWLSERDAPDVRLLGPGRNYKGRNWIGLRQNGDYAVSGVSNTPLLPAWLAVLLLLSFVTWSWWREGKSD